MNRIICLSDTGRRGYPGVENDQYKDSYPKRGFQCHCSSLDPAPEAQAEVETKDNNIKLDERAENYEYCSIY